MPLGAGLSSSAALECAVAVAVAGLLGLDLDDRGDAGGWPTACIRAENDYVGAPTGGMDQTVAMLARPGHALLLDFADASVTPVALPLDDAGLALLVIDTRVSHALTDGSYGDRRTECANAAEPSASTRSATPTSARVEELEDDPCCAGGPATWSPRTTGCSTPWRRSATGDWACAVGDVLDASHASMRDDFEISCRELDLAVESARAAGALGARMTGGGFGGSAVALVARRGGRPASRRP